jgi:hypothetical protein
MTDADTGVSFCSHCGYSIYYRVGGGVWYHQATRQRMCELQRLVAEPASRASSAPSPTPGAERALALIAETRTNVSRSTWPGHPRDISDLALDLADALEFALTAPPHVADTVACKTCYSAGWEAALSSQPSARQAPRRDHE